MPTNAPEPPVSYADLKAEVRVTALCTGTSRGPNFATLLNGEPDVPHHILWLALPIPRLGGGCFGCFRWGECGSLHTLLLSTSARHAVSLGGCCFGDGRCNVNVGRRCMAPWNCTPPPPCLGIALRKNDPWFRGTFPALLFSPTELGSPVVVPWLCWMQGSYSGMQDHISCVSHGNTCIWNAN